MPVPGSLSSVLQQTPVEVLCHRTTGVGGMRRKEDDDRIVTSGGRTHQLIGAFPVLEHMALVNSGSSPDPVAALSTAAGRFGADRT